MTDNEIIKALECLCQYEQGDCFKCPIYKSIGVDCMPYILEPALSLINRQKAEMSDLVEVVRCKDCKYYKTDTPYCKEHNKGYCLWDGVIKTKKHYCGYGERRGDAK